MMDIGRLDAEEERGGDAEAPRVSRNRRRSRERAHKNAAPAKAASAGISPTQSASWRKKTSGGLR